MRLVSYNIHGGVGLDGRRSLSRIVEVLKAIDADIVCLQEAHRFLPGSGWQDQAGRIAEGLGMEGSFQNNWRLWGGGYGNALLTRTPLNGIGRFFLPNGHERKRIGLWLERRGVLAGHLQTENGLLTLATTHWSLAEKDRFSSAEEIALWASHTGNPIILAGDFNAGSNSLEIKTLLARTGWRDAATIEPFPTFPSAVPTQRVDYFFHSSEITLRRVYTVVTPASDHLPLIVEW